jgi:hypothetical protein
MATQPLGLAELARLGSEQLAGMATAGQLRGRHLWVALRGAQRYKAAIRKGDVAGEDVQTARVWGCAACPSAVRHEIASIGAVATFCGTPFEEHCEPGNPAPTCGCLVALTFEGEAVDEGEEKGGRIIPFSIPTPDHVGENAGPSKSTTTVAAGRAVVGSEACPQGRW